MREEQPTGIEAVYTIRYSDGRPEKPGRFPISTSDPNTVEIFKGIADREPTLKEADYVFGVTWLTSDNELRSRPQFTFDKANIKSLLAQFGYTGN